MSVVNQEPHGCPGAEPGFALEEVNSPSSKNRPILAGSVRLLAAAAASGVPTEDRVVTGRPNPCQGRHLPHRPTLAC